MNSQISGRLAGSVGSLDLHRTSVLEKHNPAENIVFVGITQKGIHKSVQFAARLAYNLYNSESKDIAFVK